MDSMQWVFPSTNFKVGTMPEIFCAKITFKLIGGMPVVEVEKMDKHGLVRKGSYVLVKDSLNVAFEGSVNRVTAITVSGLIVTIECDDGVQNYERVNQVVHEVKVYQNAGHDLAFLKDEQNIGSIQELISPLQDRRLHDIVQSSSRRLNATRESQARIPDTPRNSSRVGCRSSLRLFTATSTATDSTATASNKRSTKSEPNAKAKRGKH